MSVCWDFVDAASVLDGGARLAFVVVILPVEGAVVVVVGTVVVGIVDGITA